MKAIGGFFELELNRSRDYHHDALALNLGRTAFEYVLKARKIRKIHLPFYTCDVLFGPVRRAGTEMEFYHVNESLEPDFDFTTLGEDDFFLYTNYYGIKDGLVRKLAATVSNLIIDNSQAFFSTPEKGTDTFYSPRKFFGVPDGGYLYTEARWNGELETDDSSGRFAHLIGRIENGAERSYPLFQEHDRLLSHEPLKRMSAITSRLLQNVNYDASRERRRRNFDLLHQALGYKNLLGIDQNTVKVPMVYPLLSERNDLHRLLIAKGIYVPAYWTDVTERVRPDSFEHTLVKCLVPLPLDQRYGDEEMAFIVKTVLQYV